MAKGILKKELIALFVVNTVPAYALKRLELRPLMDCTETAKFASHKYKGPALNVYFTCLKIG